MGLIRKSKKRMHNKSSKTSKKTRSVRHTKRIYSKSKSKSFNNLNPLII